MSAVAARDRILLGGRVRPGGLVLLALFSLPAVPPNGELATPAPHDRKVDRQHEQPERDHPEPEHGQEPDKTADDEENADRDADRFRLRQMPVAIEDADLVGHGLRAAGLTKPEIGSCAGRRNLDPQMRVLQTRPSFSFLRSQVWRRPTPFTWIGPRGSKTKPAPSACLTASDT